jgi:hypothetical protein
MSGASDGSAPAGGTEPPVQPILSVSDALPHKYIPKVTFNCKSIAADQALQQATDLVDRGERNWKRTNVTILYRTKHQFQLSCSKCLKKFSAANPGNFWGTHSKQCTPDGAPCGQVFQSRAWCVLLLLSVTKLCRLHKLQMHFYSNVVASERRMMPGFERRIDLSYNEPVVALRCELP